MENNNNIGYVRWAFPNKTIGMLQSEFNKNALLHHYTWRIDKHVCRSQLINRLK